MSTADRLAELRWQFPVYFWVWRHMVALCARCGWRNAVALDRILKEIK